MRTISRRTGVLIIAVMIAAVLFLSIPGQEMWRKVLQDSGHGVVFFVIGIVLALMREPRSNVGTRTVGVLLQSFFAAIGIGVLTEMIQHFQPGRMVSTLDVLHDAAGTALGLAVLAIVEGRRPSLDLRSTSPASGRGEEPSPDLRSTSPAGGRGEEPSPDLRSTSPANGRGGRSVALAVALAALVVLAWQPVECATAYARRHANYPVLAEGARPADLYFIRGGHAEVERTTLPESFRRAGDSTALRVRFAPGSRPMIELFEPAPDWRGHSMLVIDVTNPGDQVLPLILRILDEHHSWKSNDRLNLPLEVPPNSRATVNVALAAVQSAPATRPMDMARIANLALFARRAIPGQEFYVSRIWLE